MSAGVTCAASRRYAGCMRYAQGGGLTAEGRRRREQVRLEAARRFGQGLPAAVIAAELRVSERSVRRWRQAWQAEGLAADKSTAAALGGWIVFEDECGQSMRPPRSRTWGRRGITPVIRVRGGGTGHVSVAGLACYRPGHRSRLIYRLHHYRGRKG